MRVSYRVEETETGTIVSVFDDIDLANANMLADALFSVIDARRAVLVDLRGLRYIDSVGLHILLRAAQRAQRLGCAMTLVAVGPTRQLVEQIGLGRLMSIMSDLPPARVPPPEQAPKTAVTSSAPPPTAPLSVVSPPLASPSIASRSVSAQPEPEPKPAKPTEPSRNDP